MDQWALIHRYRRLAAEGKAQPLTCPDCNNEYLFKLEADDSAVAWCYMEDKVFHPGLDFWDRVKAIVSEHYLE